MAQVRRKLPKGTTAHVRAKLPNDVGGQELLSGIADHITIQNIAPKITWKACNVLQMVSRRWQQAICNRSIYDSKVLSKATEAFLVLPHVNCELELVLILYACRDGSALRLPPAFSITRVHIFDFICLDGKVYVWVVPLRKRSEVSPCPSRVEVRVLDLAGDRRWTDLKQLRHPFRECYGYSYGVLDGKIYQFQGYNFPICGVLDGEGAGIAFNGLSYIEEQVRRLPQTEVYDPLSDVWTFVTPKPMKNIDKARTVDLERHLACFSEWTREQMAVDISKKFLTNGRYESYFSEWRRGRQATNDGTRSILDDCHHSMATQVYYEMSGLPDCQHEHLFFCRERLLKFRRTWSTWYPPSGIIQMYDTERNAWRNWKSFLIDVKTGRPHRARSGTSDWDRWETSDWAYADNAIWAIASYGRAGLQRDWMFRKNGGMTYLVKSPMFLMEENDKSFMLIDTGYSMKGFPDRLRPIYL